MFLNYQASPTYRSYKYPHGHPCQVILHCLDRKSNSRKYSEEDLLSRDSMKGILPLQDHQEKCTQWTLDKKLNNQPALAQIGYNGIFHANIFSVLFVWFKDGIGSLYRNHTNQALASQQHTHRIT